LRSKVRSSQRGTARTVSSAASIRTYDQCSDTRIPGALGLDGELGHVDGNAAPPRPYQDGLARVDGELLERGERDLTDRSGRARPAPRLEHRLVHELTCLEIARAGNHGGVDEEADDGDPEQPAHGGADSHVEPSRGCIERTLSLARGERQDGGWPPSKRRGRVAAP
jgi:hypothetical protein